MSGSLKAQSQIVQFALFFMIGLGVFLSISGYFRNQLDLFGNSITESNKKLVSSYLSSIAINSIFSCKECDNFNTTVQLSNRTANFFIEVAGRPNGFDVITQPGNQNYFSYMHNIGASLAGIEGLTASIKPIILSFNKIQNKLKFSSENANLEVVNLAPNAPQTPSGQASGSAGTSYIYSTSATDPNADNVRYDFDFGDGAPIVSTNYVASGTSASASHSWTSAGTYSVTAKAVDLKGLQSPSSPQLSVTVGMPTYSATFSRTGFSNPQWGVTVGETRSTSYTSPITVTDLKGTASYAYDPSVAYVAGQSQYACDTGCSGTVTSTDNSKTASYKLQYSLTVYATPVGEGTVSPIYGSYDTGSAVTISATPNSGYQFSSWSGTGTGSYAGTSNPATVTMNGPITETANFVAASGSISGTVTDESTNSKLSGVTVSDGTRSSSTGANGAYTISDVPIGTYAVTASKTGYVSDSKQSTVAENSDTKVDFALKQSTQAPITFVSDNFDTDLSGWSYAGSPGYTLNLDSGTGQSSPSALITGDNFNKPINGMQKVVDISSWKSGPLTLSFNWRANSWWSYSTVTNANLKIEDADTGSNLYQEQLISGGSDTGWRSYSKDISPMVSDRQKIKIILYLYDSWMINWAQRNWYDNILLKSG